MNDAPRLDSTLSKGLSVLETLAASRRSKGVSELSRELGLTKSNTYRLLQTLSALGYVSHEADKTYRATLKCWQVGRAAVENLGLRAVAAPLLSYLAEITGETVYLAVRQGIQIVHIDRVDGAKPIRPWSLVGGSVPIHCVGSGKALLAHDYTRLRPLLAGRLVASTLRTITDLARLDADVAATRARGYAVDACEFADGVYSIGAAILLPDGGAAGALSVVVPDVNLAADGVARIGGLVVHAARSVSDRIARLNGPNV